MNIAHHSIKYTRDSPFDLIEVSLPNGQQQNLETTAKITEEIPKHFVQIDLNDSLMELFDEDLKRYYQQREAGLIRLEQLSEKLINDNETYRLKINQEKSDYKNSLDEEYRKKEEAISQRAEKLDNREKEMDLADSKSARRKMRQDILEKLKPESTIELKKYRTWPIHAIFIGVSLTFLVLVVLVISSPDLDPLKFIHAIKIGLPSIGLIGTLMLYYRWMDAWIRKEVDESLRLRQLGIDVDRSTWVVEMLSELKDETEKPIPDEVLTAITRNLFTGREVTKAVSHPAEDVLAALLSSSKDIEIDFPGGKIKTDGRGAKKAINKATKND